MGNIWDALAKIPSTPQQTISDDARSRLARREQADRMRMTREEYDPETGKRELWYTITIAAVAGYTNVMLRWQGTSEEDARASFLEWLAMDEFQTVDYWSDGKNVRLSFRGSWVAGFTMDGVGRRQQ
jgi:hypothetical protein